MPTPIGHALGGIAAGVFIVRRTTTDVPVGARRIPVVLFFALLGLLPDIDFLLGGHRGVTHTAGAPLAGGVLVAAVDRRPAVWLGAAAAYGGAAREGDVVSPGGTQHVTWTDAGIQLTGWAQVVLTGRWHD